MEAITLEELIEMKDELEAEKSKYKWYYEMYIQVENLSKGSPSLGESLEPYTEGYLRYMELSNVLADINAAIQSMCKHSTFTKVSNTPSGGAIYRCKACHKMFFKEV